MAEAPPGAFAGARMAPMFVGGMPLDDLVRSLAVNAQTVASQRQTADSQFWSTPRRAATDSMREVFEVNINAAKQVNAVAFDLPRFPHKAYMFYLNTKTKKWQPVLNKSRRPLVINTIDSIPATIVAAPPGSSTHAQHYGAGHWVSHQFALTPLVAASFRLILVRQKTVRGPKDHAGKPVPYSLGVRSFNVGYKIKDYKDIPRTKREAVVITERESFTSTTDLLGSPVTISVRENRATDLLKGALWKCEPQPVPNAVVCLYVDARDASGKPQVVDRFFIDPITTGVHMNLYYSNDIPSQSTFAASDVPLSFPVTRRAGAAVAVEPTGLFFPDAVGYLDIDNAAFQFDPTKSFWMGIGIQPRFDHAETTRHILVDTGTVRLEWTGSAFMATLFGISVTRDDIFFAVNQRLAMVLAYDAVEQEFFLFAQGDEHINPTPLPLTGTTSTTKMRIGGLLVGDDGDPGHGNFRLASLILKAEALPGRDTYEQYCTDFAAYVVESEFVGDDLGTTDNALLRYDPAFQTVFNGSVNQYGLVGGTGNRYQDMTWTLVARDFKVNRGNLIFNATKASAFKFEFTNLAAMPYDDYEPVARKVQVFPTAKYYPGLIAPITASGNTAGGGAIVSQNACITLHYADQVRLYTNVQIAQKDGSYTPTTALYSQSPLIQGRLRADSLYFNLQQWHLSKFAPKFVEVQKHVYEHIEIAHTNRLAFFVGLNSIQMFRVDYAVSDDTEQYLESFQDMANFARDEAGQVLSGWLIGDDDPGVDGGHLATPDGMGVTETVVTSSKVFASKRKVTGLQFATQQTPAVQLLADSDFNDPTMTAWRAYGDAAISVSQDVTSDIGTMVKVERDVSINYWNDISDLYASWDALEVSNPDPYLPVWDDLEYTIGSMTYGGIQTAQAYPVSSVGRLYAAARVYVSEPLSAPLYVQVVDGTDTVISEERFVPAAGQMSEWFSSYTIGEGGAEVALDWDGVEAIGTWDDLDGLGAWDQVDSNTLAVNGPLKVRLVQIEPTLDTWYVDNLALFDDGIIWEFSNDFGLTWYPTYDIRNDPHGCFMFPESENPQAGLGLRWRVTGLRPQQRIAYLAIRPFYDSLPLGQPYRETMQTLGPNQALIDHYPPITDDPRWKLWHKPIPEDWWFTFRQWLLQQRPDLAVQSTIVVPNSITMVDEGPLFTPLFIDPLVLAFYDQNVPMSSPVFNIGDNYTEDP